MLQSAEVAGWGWEGGGDGVVCLVARVACDWGMGDDGGGWQGGVGGLWRGMVIAGGEGGGVGQSGCRVARIALWRDDTGKHGTWNPHRYNHSIS